MLARIVRKKQNFLQANSNSEIERPVGCSISQGVVSLYVGIIHDQLDVVKSSHLAPIFGPSGGANK